MEHWVLISVSLLAAISLMINQGILAERFREVFSALAAVICFALVAETQNLIVLGGVVSTWALRYVLERKSSVLTAGWVVGALGVFHALAGGHAEHGHSFQIAYAGVQFVNAHLNPVSLFAALQLVILNRTIRTASTVNWLPKSPVNLFYCFFDYHSGHPIRIAHARGSTGSVENRCMGSVTSNKHLVICGDDDYARLGRGHRRGILISRRNSEWTARDHWSTDGAENGDLERVVYQQCLIWTCSLQTWDLLDAGSCDCGDWVRGCLRGFRGEINCSYRHTCHHGLVNHRGAPECLIGWEKETHRYG